MTEWAIGLLERGGVWGLGFAMLAENLFPPIPSEAVLPLAGFLVSIGTLGLAPAFLASTVGSVAGAVILYAVGRYGGRPVVMRWSHLLRLTEGDLDRVDEWFDRHGPKVVLFARMVPIARSVVSVPAGLSEMPIGKFLLYSTVGTAVWNALLIGAGMALGSQHERISTFVGNYSNAILAIAVVAAVAVVIWLYRRHERRRSATR